MQRCEARAAPCAKVAGSSPIWRSKPSQRRMPATSRNCGRSRVFRHPVAFSLQLFCKDGTRLGPLRQNRCRVDTFLLYLAICITPPSDIQEIWTTTPSFRSVLSRNCSSSESCSKQSSRILSTSMRRMKMSLQIRLHASKSAVAHWELGLVICCWRISGPPMKTSSCRLSPQGSCAIHRFLTRF